MTNTERDPNTLNEDIEAQRAHLGATIEALESKFSPGEIFDQVVRYTRDNGGEFSQNLVNTIKDNPIPTIMTAVGLAWMMYGQNHSRSSQQWSDYNPSDDYEQFDDYDEPYEDTPFTAGASYGSSAYGSSSDHQHDGKNTLTKKAGNLKDEITGAMTSAKDRADEAISHTSAKSKNSMAQARRQAHHAKTTLRRQTQRAQVGWEHLLHDQPLVAGAAGVAIGALIGASFPSSELEDKVLGQKRDEVMNKAAEATEGAYEKAKETGNKLATEATEKLDKNQHEHQTA